MITVRPFSNMLLNVAYDRLPENVLFYFCRTQFVKVFYYIVTYTASKVKPQSINVKVRYLRWVNFHCESNFLTRKFSKKSTYSNVLFHIEMSTCLVINIKFLPLRNVIYM